MSFCHVCQPLQMSLEMKWVYVLNARMNNNKNNNGNDNFI